MTHGLTVSAPLLAAGLAAVGLALLVALLVLFGVFTPKARKLTLEERISVHSGGLSIGAGTALVSQQRGEPQSLGNQAVGAANKALAGHLGLQERIADRLEGAGMALKPAEWLLAHVGIAFGAALVGLLLGSGGVLLTLLFLVAGAVLPWVYLGFKRGKRLKRFNGQLADTLQLIAGSLSAGLSLTQALSTVEQEGNEPVSGEFRRVLVEARLGVTVEDAMESVAERMESRDFGWVVMAIRIQREVGGNLAELLLTVAATLREREYLRRHVSALSAEGRLSAWILGGLPPVFMLYLLLTRPDYVHPLFSTPIGLLMCGAMVVLLSVGGFWMSKLVKVEV